MAYDGEQLCEISESDCCGNGCTNCILDNKNKPKDSFDACLTGRRNVILNYTKFELLHKETLVVDECTKVLRLHFGYVATEDDDAHVDILEVPPCRHIMLRAVLEANGTPLLRPYSPYWVDFRKKQFKILVKLQPGGPMSKYIAALEPQAILEFRGPIGHYAHNPHDEKHILIIAQGVAIAPTIALVNQVLDNKNDMNRLHHLVCVRNLEHLYFRLDLQEFARYWNYKYRVYMTQERCGNPTCPQCESHSPDCKQLFSKLRYEPMLLPQRLDAKALATYCKTTALTTRGSSELMLIIAGHAKFQNSMRELVANTLPVQDANIYLI